MTLKQLCAIIFVFFVTTVTSADLTYEHHYQIKHITKETFIGQDVENVHLLDFRGCGVEEISNTAFNDMRNLNYIMLRNNIIESLPCGVFNKLKNIETIVISANKLKHIPKKVFCNLNKLSMIDLSYNSISTIDIGAFDNTDKLRTIVLGCNKLTEISIGIFDKLTELTKLDLSDNLIYNIEDSALPSFHKLTTLVIHSNKLHKLNKNNVELLTSATIDKNPWLCDCKLKEVHAKWKTTFQNQGWIPICNTPKKLHNIQWHKLTTDDFVCPQIYLQTYPEKYEITAEIGRSVSLNCYITGGDTAAKVKWTYENKLDVNDVLQDAGRDFTVEFNTVKKDHSIVGVWYNITIHEVIRSDDGIYKCVANLNNKIYEVEQRVLLTDAIDCCNLTN